MNRVIRGIAEFKPEMRYTAYGKAIAHLDLLVDGKRVRVVAWEDLAEDLVDDIFCGRIIPMTTRLICTGYYKEREYKGRKYKDFMLRILPEFERQS